MFSTHNTNKKIISKQRGFTLIEIVTAIFIISAGTMGTFTIVQKVLNYTTINVSRFAAAYLVQEGVEIVKNIKDTNVIRMWDDDGTALPTPSWDDNIFCCKSGPSWNCAGPSLCECDCEADYTDLRLYDDTNRFLKIQGGFYKYSAGGTITKFKRKIFVKRPADNIGTPDIDESDKIIVKVIVEWSQKGQTYQVQAQEDLYNWF